MFKHEQPSGCMRRLQSDSEGNEMDFVRYLWSKSNQNIHMQMLKWMEENWKRVACQ